ncbi:MAG: NAD-dependent epimerase/dehydratase family protein, partial [Actinomycetota bacterium]
MRIFVSGGTGVIGWRVVRDLVAGGHEVTALARSDDKARLVEGLGARAVRAGLSDPEGLRGAVAGHDAVVNLATSIPPVSRMLSAGAWAANDRIRSEGSRNLVDAALAAGVPRFVQESVTFLYADGGDDWIDEDAPVDAGAILRSSLDAEANAARFTAAGGTGIVLRFGAFYGPDSRHTGLLLFSAKLGLDLLPGGDDDYVSMIDTDDAAAAVVAALGARAGTYNVVDDTPLRRADYDRVLAAAVGARAVRRPAVLVRATGRGIPYLARSHRVSNRRLRAETAGG